MGFENICRIPGTTGIYKIIYNNGKIEHLSPYQLKEHSDTSLWLTSGLFDIQFNGMLGYGFTDDNLTVDKVAEINAALVKKGVLRWNPTICSQTVEIVEKNLAVIRKTVNEGLAPNIHCIHLEGHYISSLEGYRGVHLPEYIRDPDPEEFDRWQKIAGGLIGIFSLAPERKGALAFIQKLMKVGVKVGIVHHNADHETVQAAAAAGADLSSHLINGCVPMINRQQNIIWSQLSLDQLWASFIADGYHIPSYTLRAVIKSKGVDRSILISDASSQSGLPDGEYESNGMTVIKQDGGLCVKGKGKNLLAGAAKTLEEDVEYLTANAGFSIEDSLKMATINPARYFGIESEIAIYEGKTGPLAVFDWDKNKLTVKEILS